MIQVDVERAGEVAASVSNIYNVDLKNTLDTVAGILSKVSDNPQAEDCLKAMIKMQDNLNNEALPVLKKFHNVVSNDIPELKKVIDSITVSQVKDHSTDAKVEAIDVDAMKI